MESLSERSGNELKIYRLRDEIRRAAAEFRLSPEIVGAIVLDELERRSFEDDIEEVLAVILPGLVYRANWSIGIAQIKPKTAEFVYRERLGNCLEPHQIVRSLLDEKISCRLVAAYCRHTIDLWRDAFPPAENTDIDGDGARLLGTLYSLEPTGTWGVNDRPIFNDRGEGIVATMPKIRTLIESQISNP